MTNKLVVVLLYEMKFLVTNYSCLQNPWLPLATAPRSPFSLSSVLKWICWTPPTKFLGTPLEEVVPYCQALYRNFPRLKNTTKNGSEESQPHIRFKASSFRVPVRCTSSVLQSHWNKNELGECHRWFCDDSDPNHENTWILQYSQRWMMKNKQAAF